MLVNTIENLTPFQQTLVIILGCLAIWELYKQVPEYEEFESPEVKKIQENTKARVAFAKGTVVRLQQNELKLTTLYNTLIDMNDAYLKQYELEVAITTAKDEETRKKAATAIKKLQDSIDENKVKLSQAYSDEDAAQAEEMDAHSVKLEKALNEVTGCPAGENQCPCTEVGGTEAQKGSALEKARAEARAAVRTAETEAALLRERRMVTFGTEEQKEADGTAANEADDTEDAGAPDSLPPPPEYYVSRHAMAPFSHDQFTCVY